ncbi:unnamed protein product [Closterium sp. NIES-54]
MVLDPFLCQVILQLLAARFRCAIRLPDLQLLPRLLLRVCQPEAEDLVRPTAEFNVDYPYVADSRVNKTATRSTPAATFTARSGAPTATSVSPGATGVARSPSASTSPPPFIGGAVLLFCAPCGACECTARFSDAFLVKLLGFAARLFFLLRHAMAASPRPAIPLVEAVGVWQSLQMPYGIGSCSASSRGCG